MTSLVLLADELTSAISGVMEEASLGHCLRVDNLDGVVAADLATRLSGRPTFQVGVLGDRADGLMITAEQAVEIRNRKAVRLCLIVPSDRAESSSSSLGNSFAVFDIDAAMRDAAQRIVARLPDEVRPTVESVMGMRRALPRPTAEDFATYVSAVAAAPSLEAAGLELWRVGLLPDTGPEGPGPRLAENERCSRLIVRPPRPQSTADERLSDLGLRPGSTRDELVAFFRGRSIRDSGGWLRELATAERRHLSFHLWPIESDEPSDLEEILVAPFLAGDGSVERWANLAQRGGPGTEPIAIVGSQAKVTVKWKSVPPRTKILARWRVRVVPSREEYPLEDTTEIDLPEVTTAASRHTATVPLDLDLASLDIRAVQIQVVGLDDFQAVIKGPNGDYIEGLSDEFWLDDRGDTPAPPETASRRETVPNLPIGRLTMAADPRVGEVPEGVGSWVDRELGYYSVPLDGRRTIAIAMSDVLRDLEEKILSQPTDLAVFETTLVGTDRVDATWGLQTVDVDRLRRLASVEPFLARRRELFRLIRGSAGDVIETVRWSTELTSRARAYARAYRDVLAEAETGADPRAPLLIDTLRLRIEESGRSEEAIVVFPTHPLRILWYAAYAELMGRWEAQLLAADSPRKHLIDLDLLERVAPVNMPAFSVTADGQPFLFAGNLRFFWGVALPVGSRDPGRRTADVARALGLPDVEVTLANVPPASVAREIDAYLGLHPYLRSLRIEAANIGSGAFVAAAIRKVYDEAKWDDTEDRSVPRLELTVRAPEPLPADIRTLADLRPELYGMRPPGANSHLNPFFAYGIKGFDGPAEAMDEVNVAISIDRLEPTIEAVPDAIGDSSSFYGLLCRFVASYSSTVDGARWTHRLLLPSQSARDRHPVIPALTDDLADTQRAILRGVAAVLGAADGDLPAVIATVRPEDRGVIDGIHARADWVVTLDRFLGPEFFDDPGSADMARVARTYVLDYGPEFLEGLGHRLMVTTSRRQEVLAVLGRAMDELGFGLVEDSVGDVLSHLKTVSGRLALRVVGDDAHAREAVSLGVVTSYLGSKHLLDDSILIPVDAHPELFGPNAPREAASRSRCDLLRVRFGRGRMDVAFIEVKSRSATAQSEELMQRIAEQIEATEDVVRDLFFRRDPPRLDRALQRSRLATILRFYLGRSQRYGLVSGEETLRLMSDSIDRLESGIPDMRAERLGFVVNLFGKPQPPVRVRDTTIQFLTAQDLETAGFVSVVPSATIELEPSATPAGSAPAPMPSSTTEPVAHATSENLPAPADQSDAGAEPRASLDTPAVPTVTSATNLDRGATDPRQEDLEWGGGSEEPATVNSALAAASADSDPQEADTDVPAKSPIASDRALPDALVVPLGERVGDADIVDWRPSVRGSPHLFVLGIPGQGKSWTIARILRSLEDHGLPALVFDFHGQFSDPHGITGHSGRVVIDAADGVPFSPFETEIGTSQPGSWKTGAFAIAEIFQYVCDLGDIQRDLVYQAIRDSYQALGYDDLTGGVGAPTVDVVRERIEELEQERGVRNVSARCRPILDFGLFRGAAESSFDDALRTGAVVDVHRLTLETLQLAAGAFVLRRIYKEMFSWGERSELRLAIVLDEAHRLARDVTLPKLMKEGRKFGVVVIVASQGLADYHPDVVGNAGTKVVFRTNFPASKKVAGFMRSAKGTDLAATIEQLDVGEAYVQTPEMSTAGRVRMYPLHAADR
jgi:hypothetical protein